jgi:hypothetical protein
MRYQSDHSNGDRGIDCNFPLSFCSSNFFSRQYSEQAIEFNKQFGMDFGKWISQGVPYVNAAQHESLNQHYFASAEDDWSVPASSTLPAPATKQRPVHLSKSQDIEFVNQVLSSVESWLLTESVVLDVPECHSFLQAVVTQELSRQHPTLQISSRQLYRRGRCVSIMTVSKEVAPSSSSADHTALNQHLGFRRIWLALIAAQLPIVGHNCMLDLLFLYAAVEGNLPTALCDFKREIHSRFPVIIDTKVLASHAWFSADKLSPESPFLQQPDNVPNVQISSTSLDQLISWCLKLESPILKAQSERCFSASVWFGSDFDGYLNSSKSHEAAYDAFGTGYVLLTLGKVLVGIYESSCLMNLDLVPPVDRCSEDDSVAWYPRIHERLLDWRRTKSANSYSTQSEFSFQHEAVQCISNYLFCMRSPLLVDLTANVDPLVDVGPDYVLTNITSSLQPPDILALFGMQRVRANGNNVQILWTDDGSSLVVSFRQLRLSQSARESVERFGLREMEQPSSGVRVHSFCKYVNQP